MALPSTTLMGVVLKLIILSRAVGTCLQVGGQDLKWGAKDRNLKQKILFLCNFGDISAKVGGSCPLGHPVPTALLSSASLPHNREKASGPIKVIKKQKSD